MAEKAEKRFASTSFDHIFSFQWKQWSLRNQFDCEESRSFQRDFPLSKGVQVQSLVPEFLFGIFIIIILDNNDEPFCTFHFERWLFSPYQAVFFIIMAKSWPRNKLSNIIKVSLTARFNNVSRQSFLDYDR